MGRTFVPTMYPLVDPETGLITSQWRRYQEGVSTAVTPGASGEVLGSNGASLVWSKIVNANVAVGAAIAYTKLNLLASILDADVAALAAIAWSKISKAGSSLADLATRSASDLNSGTLAAARLPQLASSFALWHSGGTVAAASTVFVGPPGQAAAEASVQIPVPIAGVLRNLFVLADLAAGAGQSYTYTARVNTADAAVTCQISGAAATTASDTTHSQSVAAGDVVTVKIVTSAGSGVARHAMALEIATA